LGGYWLTFLELPIHVHAHDFIEGWSKTSQTTTEATEPCHSRGFEEGGDQASTSRDHLPHFRHLVGQSHPCGSQKDKPHYSQE